MVYIKFQVAFGRFAYSIYRLRVVFSNLYSPFRLAEVNKVPDKPEADLTMMIGKNAGAREKRCFALFHNKGIGAAVELSADRVSAAFAYDGGKNFL